MLLENLLFFVPEKGRNSPKSIGFGIDVSALKYTLCFQKRRKIQI